jgi:hypothetical protein
MGIQYALVIIFVAIVGCNLAYCFILQEVNKGRTKEERISRFENLRVWEVLQLHKEAHPQSRKRILLWVLLVAAASPVIVLAATDIAR